MPMHPQLQEIIDELNSARKRLHKLADEVPFEQWSLRPASGGWSISECVAHLNLTSKEYLPRLRDAVELGTHSGAEPRKRYRRDPMGWVLWKMIGPPVRKKVKTSPQFVPTADEPPEQIVKEFDRLQDELIEIVREAEDLPLTRLQVVSPFDPRVKYNLYSAFTIIAPHQHRHLWQAEQGRAEGEGRRAEG